MEIELTDNAFTLWVIGLGYLMSALIFEISCKEKIGKWLSISRQEKRTHFRKQQ